MKASKQKTKHNKKTPCQILENSLASVCSNFSIVLDIHFAFVGLGVFVWLGLDLVFSLPQIRICECSCSSDFARYISLIKLSRPYRTVLHQNQANICKMQVMSILAN